MIGHSLELDDLKKISSPKKIVVLFEKLGYDFQIEHLDIEELEIPNYCSEAINNAYKIYNPKKEELQVFLLELGQEKFQTHRKDQEKIITIFKTISKNKNDFLLIGTKQYNKLIIVASHSRENTTLKNSIKWWLIDCKKPNFCDIYWIENVALNYWKSTEELTYKDNTEAGYDPDREPPNATFTEDSIQLYYKQINNFPRLHPEEEINLAHQINELLALEEITDCA